MEKSLKLIYRTAEIEDLPKLVAMLADDQLGSNRENSSPPLNEGYLRALQSIDTDPNNELIVVTL